MSHDTKSDSESDRAVSSANQSQSGITSYQTGFESFEPDQADSSSVQQSEDKNQSEETESEGAVSYNRVSDTDQVDDGESIETQKTSNRKAAESHDIPLLEEIEDPGKSGQDLDRPGFRELCKTVEKPEIKYIVVDHISRLGRCVPELPNFIHEIRMEHDVKLIIAGRIYDVQDPSDKLFVHTMALMADLATTYQSRKAKESTTTNFVDKNKWRSAFRHIPFGYVDDGNEWIEPDPEMVPVVQKIHELFAEVTVRRPYAEVANVINEKFSDRLETELESNQIKRILVRPVYAGCPARGYKIHLGLDEEHCTINEDESLQMIDLETFYETRQKIREVNEFHSSSSETLDEEGLRQQFGLEETTDKVDCVEVVCKECDEVELMSKNGTREVDGETGHVYVCDSGHSRIVPHVGELRDLEGTDDPRKN